MKKDLRRFLTVGCLTALIGATAIPALAKDEDSDKDTKITGSIQVEGKHKRAELPALAKISFDDALKAAEAKVPGSVIKAQLEVEHHTLIYSFEILVADKTVTEVEIDAGDGKVLDVDKD
jgi:uncharacterized membrane protein YkoI